MASISSSTSFSASRGISGLVSGLDTESMVEKLLSGTQAKIDKQNGTKQQLLWKQETYRDVISQLTGFQDKFFNFLNPTTNLLSKGFYNAMAASTKSAAVRVTAGSSALTGKISIKQVNQLAAAAKYQSGNTVSSALTAQIDSTKMPAEGDAAVDITLDGIKKTIRFSGADANAIRASLKQGIENAFGTTNITVGGTGNQIDLSPKDASSQITVSIATDGNGGLDVLGFKPWQSNKVSTAAALKDLNLAKPLVGSSFAFEINGKTITATAGESMGAVIERINSSGAGVKVSYSSITDKFSIEASETGAGRTINLKDTTGNLLSTMFGIGSGGSVQSSALISGKLTAANAIDANTLADGFAAGSSFSLIVDGVERSFNFGSSNDIPFDTGVEEMNRMLGVTYGTTKKEDGTIQNNIELVKDADGKMQLINRTKQVISISNKADNLLADLGFNAGQSTKLDGNSKLTDFGFVVGDDINGVAITEGMTAEAFATALQTELKKTDGTALVTIGENGSLKVTAEAQLTLTGSAVSKFFGADTVELNNTGAALAVVQAGQNAQVTMADGAVIERASNSFEIDGVNVELLATTSGTDPVIDIDITRNTEQILTGIKSFVAEYNSMIDKFNKLTTEEASYRKYPPLTAEQKKEMTEQEIKVWEDKAKEGLLRGDTIINGVLSTMRSTLYSKPEGAQFALYDLGITTGNWQDNGKLNINDEAKLKKIIEDNSIEIEKLFTDASKGLAVEMNKILDGAAKKSTASPGSLVSLAGIKGFGSDLNNTLARQMKDIDKTVEGLKRTYEAERTRYWKQFSAMEKVINNMNQQSSWLASQLG